MTYKKIQKYYKHQYKTTIKTCWIADVRRELGLPTRLAYNRKNQNFVIYPCPKGKIKKRIKSIIKLSQKLKAIVLLIAFILFNGSIQAQKVFSVQYV